MLLFPIYSPVLAYVLSQTGYKSIRNSRNNELTVLWKDKQPKKHVGKCVPRCRLKQLFRGPMLTWPVAFCC